MEQYVLEGQHRYRLRVSVAILDWTCKPACLVVAESMRHQQAAKVHQDLAQRWVVAYEIADLLPAGVKVEAEAYQMED